VTSALTIVGRTGGLPTPPNVDVVRADRQRHHRPAGLGQRRRRRAPVNNSPQRDGQHNCSSVKGSTSTVLGVFILNP
jgi:hypothetical protein